MIICVVSVGHTCGVHWCNSDCGWERVSVASAGLVAGQTLREANRKQGSRR